MATGVTLRIVGRRACSKWECMEENERSITDLPVPCSIYTHSR